VLVLWAEIHLVLTGLLPGQKTLDTTDCLAIDTEQPPTHQFHVLLLFQILLAWSLFRSFGILQTPNAQLVFTKNILGGRLEILARAVWARFSRLFFVLLLTREFRVDLADMCVQLRFRLGLGSSQCSLFLGLKSLQLFGSRRSDCLLFFPQLLRNGGVGSALDIFEVLQLFHQILGLLRTIRFNAIVCR
jgi:hypothetical protein